jgi:hypothetical protein
MLWTWLNVNFTIHALDHLSNNFLSFHTRGKLKLTRMSALSPEHWTTYLLDYRGTSGPSVARYRLFYNPTATTTSFLMSTWPQSRSLIPTLQSLIKDGRTPVNPPVRIEAEICSRPEDIRLDVLTQQILLHIRRQLGTLILYRKLAMCMINRF